MSEIPLLGALFGGSKPDTSGLERSNRELQDQLSATKRADNKRRLLQNSKATLSNNGGLLNTLRTALPQKQLTIGA